MTDTEKPEQRRLANDNPWYCLATLHGEQPIEGLDPELTQNNRNAWNRWYSDMTDEQREEFARTYVRRTGRPGVPPEPAKYPDFSNTHFERAIDFECFHFNSVDFGKATFSSFVNFTSATFSGITDFKSTAFLAPVGFGAVAFSDTADFAGATFSGKTYFGSAQFSGAANFSIAKFSDEINFRLVVFSEAAIFFGTTFAQSTYFISTIFTSTANFSSARFSDTISFMNTKFSGQTDFANARFESRVPDFRGATMHDATEWHGTVWPKPTQHRGRAQEQVYAYERLKQEMERLKKHEDEQTFFRRELRARRALVSTMSVSWFLNLIYQVSSDYGNSFSRPLLWLSGIFAAGIATFTHVPLCAGQSMPLKLATRFSFANIFVFLPDKREIMAMPEMAVCLSNWTATVSATQSLLGVVLLFLLGLALRNRFRMK